jgi:glycosyltransferase involved in cell wall biosynthesis
VYKRQSYINSHGETGFVVPGSEPVAFREAMRTLWNNPQMAQEMGRKAEQRYWQLFTADKMAQRYVAMYQQLLAGSVEPVHATPNRQSLP